MVCFVLVEFCSGGLGQSGCVPFCSVVFWKVTAVELCPVRLSLGMFRRLCCVAFCFVGFSFVTAVELSWDGLSWVLLSFGGSVESS